MNFRDFLGVAMALPAAKSEAEWRSAISRAYYAAFQFGCDVTTFERDILKEETWKP